MKPGPIVAVFGGGGVKAAAHVGARRALAEAGIAPEHYVGTSMGAIIAAMFAGGMGAEEALRRVAAVKQDGVVKPERFWLVKGLFGQSVLRGRPLRDTIAALVPVERFDQLVLPLTVTAVDMESGALVLFGHGGRQVPLVDALYASAALPVFYPPGVIEERAYVDGGLRAVLPLDVAATLDPSLVIAVDAGPGFDEAPSPSPSRLPPMVQVHNDSLGVLMAEQTAATLARWRATAGRPPLIYVRPRVEKGATFRVADVARYAEEGYRATREAVVGLLPR
jgi:NTE family protein